MWRWFLVTCTCLFLYGTHSRKYARHPYIPSPSPPSAKFKANSFQDCNTSLSEFIQTLIQQTYPSESSSLLIYNHDLCHGKYTKFNCDIDIIASIVKATKYLEIYVWEDEWTRQNLVRYHGTGVMIAPNKMLTSRHNVERVVALEVCDSPKAKCIPIRNPLRNGNILHFNKESGDIAVVTIPTQYVDTNASYIKYVANEKCLTGSEIFVIGYPSAFVDKNTSLDNCLFDGRYVLPVYSLPEFEFEVGDIVISVGNILSEQKAIDYALNWWNAKHSIADAIKSTDIQSIKMLKSQLKHSASVLYGMSGGGIFHVSDKGDIYICGMQSYEEATVAIHKQGQNRTGVSPNVGTKINWTIYSDLNV